MRAPGIDLERVRLSSRSNGEGRVSPIRATRGRAEVWESSPDVPSSWIKAMYERLYRTEGRKPAEELHMLLMEVRVRHQRFNVTLGAPPFERDGCNHITGIRLRFTPTCANAQTQV